MQCPTCRSSNRDGSRVCEACGVALSVDCFHCGVVNSPGGRFCSGCGTSLGPVEKRSGAADLGRDAAAERRQLTIMFCDLVGYTTLSTQFDPEDLRDLIRRYKTLVSAEIRRYDGSVASFIGDGIMAYFGYPRAHEDDAERAVLAGLDIVDAVRQVPTSRGDAAAACLSVRVGIATGEVVVGDLVGDGVSERWAVIGETPNLAARLQTIAEPNSVAISARTHRLAGSAFEYVDLGLRELKGLPTPMKVWGVTGKKTASRFDSMHGRTLTPMVGREPELSVLDRCWELACAGRGRTVVIRGDGGIGKSRMTQIFWERLAGRPGQRLQFQCSSYHANSALRPVIAHIEQAARFSPSDSDDDKCRRIERLFGFDEIERETGVPLIASMLSVPYEGLYPKLAMEPGRQRERTLALLMDRIHRLASRTPLLCVVEDAHWIDPSTLEVLHKMVGIADRHAILMLVTCRPEFAAPWASGPTVTDVRLERFTEREVERIVTGVTAGKSLPPEVMTQIVAKADGVPLFAEELTKTVLDSDLFSGTGQQSALLRTLRELAIPRTLHDLLMARLDRLPHEKMVAHVASVIGRSFDYDLLAAVAELPDDRLSHALERLQEAELIYERPSSSTRTFEFKHALIQDAAYQSQLKSGRRRNHEKIARVLETRFPGIASTQPEVVAHHYGEAQCVEAALRNWQAAGVRAIERSANVEALRHFDEALRLLPQVEDAQARATQELQVQLARGIMLTAVEGYASPSVELAYVRALELCETVGTDQQKFGALFGLWLFSMVGGRLPAALRRGQELLAHAEHAKNTTTLMLGHRALGTTHLLIGDLVAACEHTTLGFGLYDRQEHGKLAFRFGHDPGVALGVYRGWTLCLLGFGDDGLAASQAALALARDLKHPVSVAFALCYLGIVEIHRGDYAAARDHADEAAALGADHRMALWGALAWIIRGWALLGLGDVADGIALLRDGVAAWLRTGAGAGITFYHTAEAWGLLQLGRPDEALAIIDEGAMIAERNGEFFYRAELVRLRGEAIASVPSPGAADRGEALLRESLAIAREQRARAFELRTAIALGRLLAAQGRRAEALELVEPVHGWFTQGLGTVDLVAARGLIADLRATVDADEAARGVAPARGPAARRPRVSPRAAPMRRVDR